MHAIHRRNASENQRLTALLDRVSATDKKTRKRRKNKSYWGKPRVGLKKGFDAFTVKQTTFTSDGKKTVSVGPVAPEIGIHSRAWAQEIVPQTGFLTLPIEIRHRIYEDLLGDGIIQNPRKKETKYITSDRVSTTIRNYNLLTLISRQTYVDVVGGSLLYQFARFAFSSPDTMTRYLSCINPAHRSAIRKVSLTISLTRHSPIIRPLAFTTLSSLPSLQSLKMILSFSPQLCSAQYGLVSHLNHGAGTVSVRPPIVDALGKLQRWEDIKGLNDFSMIFKGTLLPDTYMVRDANGNRRWADWQIGFFSNDPRLLEIEKKIRELVTRRG